MLGKETVVCDSWFGIKDSLWSTPVISYRFHKTMFFVFFFEWKLLVRGTVPILNVPACRVLYTEIPSNLEVGWSCPGNCPLPVMH